MFSSVDKSNTLINISLHSTKLLQLIFLVFVSIFSLNANSSKATITCQEYHSGDIRVGSVTYEDEDLSTSRSQYQMYRHIYCRNKVFKATEYEVPIVEAWEWGTGWTGPTHGQTNDTHVYYTYNMKYPYHFESKPFSYRSIGYSECKYPFTVELSSSGGSSCTTYCPSNKPLDLDYGICRPKLDKLDTAMCSEKVLNPIVASSGEKAQTFSPDFNLPGKFPLKLQRSYGSARAPEIKYNQRQKLREVQASGDWVRYTQPSNYTGPKYSVYQFNTEPEAKIGFKQWRHNYQLRLIVLDEGKTAVELANSELRVFNKKLSDYVAEGKKGDYLTKLSTGWKYIGADSFTYIFDEAGQLIQINHSSGEYQTISHNALGLVSQVTHSSNGAISFEYDANHLLIKAILPDLSVYLYEYDARFNLVKATSPSTKTQQYHYEDVNHPFALTGITDERSVRYATWQYDIAGRAVTSSHAGGADAGTIAYSADGKTVTVTNANGKDKILNYSDGRLLSIVGASCDTSGVDGTMSYVYDDEGRVTSKTDEMGNRISFTYNARGLVTSKTELSGTNEAQTTSFEYHSIHPLMTKITSPVGKVVNNTYGENGRLETSEQLADGRSRLTSYSYNQQGLLWQVDGPRTDVNDVTTFFYNASHQLTKMTNVLNQSVEYLTHDSNGRIKQIKEPNGSIIFLDYDARGRLTKTTVGSRTTNYQYNAIGQVTQVASAGTQINYEYDAARRLTAIADSQGNRIELTVDLMGNIIQRDIKGSDATIVFTQQYVYDTINRLSKTTNATQQSWTNEYDVGGNLIKQIAPNNTDTETNFDALRRATQNFDQANSATGFEYNKHNQLTKVTDALNHSTTYEYNLFGELIKQTSPDSGITSFTYDEAGNLATKTDAKNITATYSYDVLNRVSNVSYSGSSDTISYSYDNAEPGRYGIGRLTQISDASGSTKYYYNAQGEIVKKATSFTDLNGTVFDTLYSYNLDGNVSQITYPSGRVIDITFDTTGKLNGISHTFDSITKPLASDIQYLPFGPITSLTYGNGKLLTRSYDLDYRLTSNTTTAISQLNYAFDVTNNITSITDVLDSNQNKNYSYDVISRLIGDNTELNFSYDVVGNRLTKTENAVSDNYVYAGDSQHLTSVAGTNNFSMNYDATGNLLSKRELSFSYNQQGRLKGANKAGMSAVYGYNFKGERVIKSVNGVRSHFLFNLQGQLIAEVDDQGSVIREYVFLGNEPLANFVTTQASEITLDEEQAVTTGSWSDVSNAVAYQGDAKTVSKLNKRGRNSASASWNINLTTGSYEVYVRWISARKSASNVNYNVSHGSGTDSQLVDQSTGEGQWYLLGTYSFNATAGISVANDANGVVSIDAVRLVPTVSQTTKSYFYHNDHLGTPQALTDEYGMKAWQASYSPFGKASLLVEDIVNNLRFPGQYYDEESGLHYNYFRDYDPELGRYIQSDPIGLAGGINTYGYAYQNPIMNTDPTGLWVPQAIGALVNMGYEGYNQYQSGNFNMGRLAVAGATGALGGFGSSALKAIGFGSLAGATNSAYQEIDSVNMGCKDEVDSSKIVRSSLLGGLGGLTGFGFGNLGKNIYKAPDTHIFDPAIKASINYGTHGSAVGTAVGGIVGNQ